MVPLLLRPMALPLLKLMAHLLLRLTAHLLLRATALLKLPLLTLMVLPQLQLKMVTVLLKPLLKMLTVLPRPLLSPTTHRSQCHCPSMFNLDQLFFLKAQATTHRHHHAHRTSRHHQHPSVPRTGLLPHRRDHPHQSLLTSLPHHLLLTSPSLNTSQGHHHHHHSRSPSTVPVHPSPSTSHLSRHPNRLTDLPQQLPSLNTSQPSLSTTHLHHHQLQLTSQSPPQLFHLTSPAARTKPGPKLNPTCPRSSASMLPAKRT